MELWGGIECTINRVGNEYLDQLVYSGHYHRSEDINLFADLGVTKMRYPVLWEKHQPETDTVIDWSNTESKLLQLKERGVAPIAGLVHHGSGPAYVNMLEDTFVYGLADYAAKVAERFPWLEYYTPVNEPLTTARFCGLYGLWHPHGDNDRSFLKILVNECKATVLAMQQIRKINPAAKLVQTEDLGKIHSTPLLKYQADFENNRRWLSFDLLCGKVVLGHPLYVYLQKNGISSQELAFFEENPCPPDVMGLNYYLTSERYIDENISQFPPHTYGGNGKYQYADVEVVRVGNAKSTGLYNLLKEAWDRFQLPMAVTEVHLHCTREEQLRWVQSIWETGKKLEQENINLVAITAWALLGSFGWNRLLTMPNGDYEPGVFDVLSGYPRITAVGKMLKVLAEKQHYDHPLLKAKGWWERDSRVIYNKRKHRVGIADKHQQPLLVIGKNSSLPKAFARLCDMRNIKYHLLSKTDLDITNREQIKETIERLNPWAIVNTASFVKLDHAEVACDSCYQINTHGPENLAYFSNLYNIKLLTFSSDMVFDGAKNDPYFENDAVNPLNTFGQSKALAEQYVLKNDPSALIVRTGILFSPWDHQNDVVSIINSFKTQKEFMVEHDVFISPTYVPDLVNTSLNLLIDDESGIWHLANSGTVSRAALAMEIARRGGYNLNLVNPVSVHTMDYKAVRPKYTSLQSERGMLLPSLENALSSFFNEHKLIA
jgi:dTDP-4-dehydrorhamnose reductase